MIHYLIEFRFHGKAKYEIKKLVYEINRKFGLRTKRPIPHITLAGPFYTRGEKRLIGDFNRLCLRSPLMNFEIDEFSAFENSKVVFLDVKPSSELEEFRYHLAQSLKPYCQLRPLDYQRDFDFHATIAMKLSDDRFSRIKDYIERKQKLNFKHVIVRATLLKGGFILREYDFLQRRLLNRRQALNRHITRRSKELLRRFFEGSYNPDEIISKFEESKPQSL